MGKLTNFYNLQKINPKLAKEWHPTRNGKLTPNDVTPSSDRKAWWICVNNHEWLAKIDRRAHGTGCPYCAGQSVCHDNCLQTKNPDLAKEWHPTKNGNLTPKDIVSGSNRIVWWQCKKGHEWQVIVKSRMIGSGCPVCTGRFPKERKNLQEMNPKLSNEWHPVKNGNLKPTDVMPYSQKRVWWRCQKAHVWQTAITTRTKGSGCPYCAGRLASKDRNLKALKPRLAQEWHSTKNGDLLPENILPGSHKRVWWRCGKGHEWQAYVFSRNKGNGCPYCFRLKRSAA